MTPIQVGEEVRVFDFNGSRRGQPPGGWAGYVVKVGRTLAHIEYERSRGAEAFRLGDCRRNDNYGHQYFKTLERVALDDRMHAALSVLRERHITIEARNSLTLEQIEALAEVAGTFTETGD